MLLNILLDYTFMQKLDLGVAGAAWAAVLSQLMACGVSLAYMFRRYDLLRFYGKGITTGREDVALIVKTGFPMALQSMIGTVFKKMMPIRTANYTRADRTSIGHEVEVRYIAELLV